MTEGVYLEVNMRRFFADDSFWNQPLAIDAEIDPRNDHYLNLLARKPGGPLHINLHNYTIPVYEVNADTPRRTIHQRIVDANRKNYLNNRWGKTLDDPMWFHNGPGFGNNVPIPIGATPDAASDAHMAMIDWDSMTAWDTWACKIRPDGEYESYTGMVYSLAGSGVWTTADFPNVKNDDSIHFHGPSRASGVPAIAGLIMYDEIQAGHIDHKLAFATWHNAYKKFTPPAAWTDGFRKDGLPEGAIMRLDPQLNLNKFNLSPAARIVCTAMQQYGAVNTDNAGGNTLYGEGLWNHPTKSWHGLLEEGDLYKIPLEHYQIMKIGAITELGDCWLVAYEEE